MGIKVKVGLRETVVPPGQYKAQIVRIAESKFFNRPGFEFHFEIADGEHKGVQLRAFMNANYEAFSAHTKLYKWFVIATKDQIEPGGEIDLDAFYSKIFLVEIDTKTSRKTKNQFSNVTNLLEKLWDL